MKYEEFVLGGITYRYNVADQAWECLPVDGDWWVTIYASDIVYLLDELQRVRSIEKQIDTAPLYYVLRRTVGGTTGHYEYLNEPIDEVWTDDLHHAFLWSDDEAVHEMQKEVGGEILPIRLLIGGVAG